MKFEMNNRNWEIIELSQEEMREVYSNYKWDGEPQDGRYYGLTYTANQKVYIDKDLCKEQKRQTLMHELMHCYLSCTLFSNSRDYTTEELCDISSNSHDIIHEIVEKYFCEDVEISRNILGKEIVKKINDSTLQIAQVPIMELNNG